MWGGSGRAAQADMTAVVCVILRKAEGPTSTGGLNPSVACISRWAPYILTTVKTGTAP